MPKAPEDSCIEEKITTADFLKGDIDEPLRPKSFDEFVGQDKVKDNIRVFVEAAKILENESLTIRFYTVLRD